MELDWPRLIQEHHDWEAHNFPGVALVDDLMGVQEEIGELTHHHLKLKWGIRGNEDHITEGQDAVGDTVIYLLGVMHHIGMNRGPEMVDATQLTDANRMVLLLGCQLGQVHGACMGMTDGAQYYVNLLANGLRRYSNAMGWDFEDIVTRTWVKVRARDWQKDPVSGVSAGSAIDLLREHDGDPDWEGV